MKKVRLLVLMIFILGMIPMCAEIKHPKKIVLVLGSGGNKGLAHVGVIEELKNMGIEPDIIVGCSSGAVIGALYAQHRDIAKVKEILIDLKYDELIDFSLFQKNAFSTSKKMESFLNEHLLIKDFESLETRFIAVVTDLKKGEPMYFEKGELHSLVLASAALPGLFPPCEIENKTYVDGGICDPLPVRFAKTLGDDVIIIASDISPAVEEFEHVSVIQIVRKSFEIMYQRLAFFEKIEADILLEMNFSPDLDSPFEDSCNQEIYERGKKVVQDQAKKILKLIPVSK